MPSPQEPPTSRMLEILRPLAVSLLAVGVLVWLMVLEGRSSLTGALALVAVAIMGLTVWQVYSAAWAMRRRSQQAEASAAATEEHFVTVLTRMVRFLEARDGYTRGHSARVAELSERIGRAMGLSDDACRELRLAGQLHDLGMMAIPAKILAQPQKMAAGEFRAIKEHPVVAYEVLKPLPSMAGVLEAVRGHHERMNGTGYPDGLGGEKIPLAARILAVADSYDAMTHGRPQRPAIAPHQALGELRRCSGAGYDSRCVETLGQVLNLPGLEPSQAERADPAIC